MSASAEPLAKPAPLKLFISYAHEDEPYRAALEKYLLVLKLQGLLEHWDDRRIVPGDKWEGEINPNLNAAQIIVLLVSIDFVGSSYIREKEMQAAMERHAGGLAVVVPVLVRVTPQWTNVLGLGSLQALPLKPGAVPEEVIPVKKWEDAEEAWDNVIGGLVRTIDKFRATLATRPAPAAIAEVKPDTTAITEASADGLQAMRARLATDEVRAVVVDFRAGFATAREQIAFLSDLKDLHDQLHTLQFQCYSFALNESRRTADLVNWDGLVLAETSLQQLVAGMQEVATRPTLAAADLAWIAELATAHDELRAASDTSDLATLKTATKRIGRVLALQPFKIDMQLSSIAGALPLAELEEGMTRVRQALGAIEGDSGSSDRLDRGVAALSQLRGEVERLTHEHTQWQEVDAEMRRIEAQLGQDLGDLEFAWDGLKKRLLALCAISQERWAAVLREEIEKLETALAAGVPAKVSQAFRRTYSQAGARFYDVDFELKKLCDELRKVGAELDELLKES